MFSDFNYLAVKLVTHKEHTAAEVYPEEYNKHGTDGAIEYVVVVEIVDIELEAPREEEKHEGRHHGAD